MNSISKSLFLLTILFTFTTSFTQTVKQEKMKQLHFMVGEWVGTSKSYKNGKVESEIPAFQKIRYQLDSNLIVIDLSSQTLQLHTVIYYDEKDSTYYYTAFSKRGSGKLPAELKEGKLIVTANATTRFIFSATSEGGFREYGEKLVNGKWEKYFEDTFTNTF